MKNLPVKLLLLILTCLSFGTTKGANNSSFRRVDQGPLWTRLQWEAFYSTDQGSRIMPYEWMVAMVQPNGLPFLRDSMARYGYLPNATNQLNPKGLPVGFLVAKSGTNNYFSITCAACHTRQININGVNYRIDGGPGVTDVYSFFKDINSAAAYTISSPQVFAEFQGAVAAQGVPAPTQQEFIEWYVPLLTVMSSSLMPTSWGIGRMDAVSMIQNRASGLDLGQPPSYLIPENINPADVPVRYPFLWNASKQDLTQWAGTSVNVNADYSLARNSSETIGTFGILHPQVNAAMTNGYDFLSQNSLNYEGLIALEDLIKQMGPPKWPGTINAKKAAAGAQLFASNCASCHGIQKSGFPEYANDPNIWGTPVINVGTDTAYHGILNQESVTSGLLGGLTNPVTTNTIPYSNYPTMQLVNMLNDSALVQQFPDIVLNLKASQTQITPQANGFESRVLQGIWAAAPYLHNGSVPTLAELLKPPASRVKSFQVGPNYDMVNVGLAARQPGGRLSLRVTTSDLTSGNSNAGHEFGTWLSPAQKSDLLEYLKTL